MLKRLLVACLLLVGCEDAVPPSSDAFVFDVDGGAQTGQYELSKIVQIVDDCALALRDGARYAIPLVDFGPILALGNRYDSTSDPVWSPPGFGFGSGLYDGGTTATLTAATKAELDDGCTWKIGRTSQLQFTSDTELDVDFLDEESDFQGCSHTNDGTPDVASCTSHFTFHLTMEPM